MNLDDKLHILTTLVYATTPGGNAQGSAFFYQRRGVIEPSATPGLVWQQIENAWLVTNRHVVLPRIHGQETAPDSFTVQLRVNTEAGLAWDPLVLSREQLLDRARFHRDSSVDVAVVRILDLIGERMSSGPKYLSWHSVTREQFAGQNNITMQVSDDVVVAGYPRGFYDEVNLFPIVKCGTVASRWGANFQGKRCFLIDAKLFPGSSGSIVLSKPADIVVKGGSVFSASEKQFAFLGIFSGEPFVEGRVFETENLTITERLGFNVGIVWYADLVEEIVNDGIPYAG
jgi:hypothetical protein